MPCKICGNKLVFIQGWPGPLECPKCNNIRIVERPRAIEISKSWLDYLYSLFVETVRQFNKNRLIPYLVWEREKFSRSFIREYQTFNIPKFLSYSILIKRIMGENSFSGKIAANQENTDALVEQFSKYVRFLTDHSHLEDGLAELKANTSFEAEKLSISEKLSNFSIIVTEDIIPIYQTLANNQIYNEAEAQRKYEEYRKDLTAFERRPLVLDPKSYISLNFDVLNLFYCGMLRDEIWGKDVFNFANYQRAHIIPEQVMAFANIFPTPEKSPAVVDSAMFRVWLDRAFDSNLIEIERLFVFCEGNQTTFPLFVELGDQVLVPHATAYLVSRLLYPIVHKELFDAETVRKSKELEMMKVGEAFNRAGFGYCSNLTDKKQPSMQIDGMATRNRELWVVEVKGWRTRRYFEHRKNQDELARDLRGVIDGWKYSTIEGIQRREKKVSLLEKMEFVKRNMSIWGFRPEDYDAVNGVIIIKDYPPMTEYHGVKIRSVNEVGTLS